MKNFMVRKMSFKLSLYYLYAIIKIKLTLVCPIMKFNNIIYLKEKIIIIQIKKK